MEQQTEQQQQIDIEATKAASEKAINLDEALARLTTNPDFKAVIEQAYFIDEPARLASLLGDINSSFRWAPGTDQAHQIPPPNFIQMRDSIQADLHAIGSLKSFFRVVAMRAQWAKNALDELAEMQNAAPQADGETTESFEA